MNVLILYGTSEGQTEKIAARMAEFITDKGHKVRVQSGKQLPAGFSLDGFDAAIIGGSIHMGKYQSYVKRFVIAHRDWLNNSPSGFFSVCMAINSQKEKSRTQAKSYADRFFKQTGWQPRLTETFAGAVKYTQYGFITRFIMKMISKSEGGSTDTSRDHEYTDWAAVENFTEKFLGELAG